MEQDKIAKLPKWAQGYIQELQQRAERAEAHAAAALALAGDHPTIEPDVPPPDSCSVLSKGWVARRSYRHNIKQPSVDKACSSAIYHHVGGWDNTTTQRPISVYSTPALALRSVLPEIVAAYRDEMAAALTMLEKLEQEGKDNA